MTEGMHTPRSSESPASHHTDLSGTTTTKRRNPLPPSPPATDEALQRASSNASTDEGGTVMGMLERVVTQENCPSFAEFLIDQRQYKRHVKDIERLVRRHDYDPRCGLLIVRMPSAIHEIFVTRFVRTIEAQLETMATSGGEAGEFASEIESLASTTIFLREPDRGSKALRREPDGQFQHSCAIYPGVVVEVSYSQDGKSVRKLAQEYILGSNGDIKAVIGIDINPPGKESTISIWRPRYVTLENACILEVVQEVSSMPFRTADGSPANREERLTLFLNDFATDEIPCGHDAVPLSIDLERLYYILSMAENRQRTRHPGVGFKSQRPTIQRWLSSSSVEELSPKDEARFTKNEEDAAKKADLRDSDYKAGMNAEDMNAEDMNRNSTTILLDAC